jgi:hypothetical protein
MGDVAQTQRARRIEEDQQQVGDPLEPIGVWHRHQSRTHAAGF